MNTIRAIQKLNERELAEGTPPSSSWHTDYRDTAFIYIGGLPYELSEGDVITVFSQYGEPVWIKMARDRETGKSKGYCWLKYEDQRSCDLAVDNLGGAKVMDRILRVDHTRYAPKDDEDMRDNTMGELEEQDEGTGRHKGQRTDSESESDEDRPMLPEEIELEKLMQIDDDDPMKESMVRKKQKEVDAALKKLKKAKKREKKKHHSRRHHRDRDRSRDRDRDRDHGRSKRIREESDTEPSRRRRSRSRDDRDEHKSSRRSGRDRSREHERRRIKMGNSDNDPQYAKSARRRSRSRDSTTKDRRRQSRERRRYSSDEGEDKYSKGRRESRRDGGHSEERDMRRRDKE